MRKRSHGGANEAIAWMMMKHQTPVTHRQVQARSGRGDVTENERGGGRERETSRISSVVKHFTVTERFNPNSFLWRYEYVSIFGTRVEKVQSIISLYSFACI